MCFNISSAAWTIRLSGIRKIVFLAICDRADKDGKAWPSVEWLTQRCGLSERAVRNHIGALTSLNLLRRVERMGRSTIYYINLSKLPGYGKKCADDESCPPPERADSPEESAYQADKDDSLKEALAGDATLPPAAITLPAPEAPPPRHMSAVASAPEAPIYNEYSTIDTINIPPAPAEAVANVAVAVDMVDAQVLKDFAAVRKAKRKPAVTQTEMTFFKTEGKKIGMSLADVLRVCVLRSWSRFEATWLPTPAATPSAAVSLVQPTEAPIAKESTVKAGVSTLAAIRQSAMSSVCTTGSVGLAWAHAAIAKKKAGLYVSLVVVRNACTALNMSYKSIC